MEKKAAILLVHNAYRITGGEDTVVANEMRLLQEHGHRVITYFRSNEELDKLPLWRRLLFPLGAIFSLRSYRDITRLIRAEKVDIVHVHNTLAMVSPAVYYAARACGVPVVQTVHNFRFLCPAATFFRAGRICEECLHHGLCRSLRYGCYRNSRLQTLVALLCNRLHRHLYRRLHFICLTAFNRRKLLEINHGRHRSLILPERVHIKPNFAAAAPAAPRAPQLPAEPFVIFAARLDETKGVRVLLDAWKLMGAEAPLLMLCGSGPMEEECRRFITENALGRVQYRGPVPHDELLALLPHAAALVLPSQWYEGFPVSIAEAYAAGIPVLGSALGNVGSLVETYGGLTFDHASPEALAAAVQQLTATPPALHREAMAPMVSAEANYRLLTTIYGKALADQGRG